MPHDKIDHFSFWQPIAFEQPYPGTTKYSKWAFYIGSLADQYATLSQTITRVEAEHINDYNIFFERKEIDDVPLWRTALKIGTFVISCGSLLLLAFTIKVIFKRHLNACRVLTKKSPNITITEKQIGHTKIILLYGSVTDETTDAIVNAANARLTAGAGVCGAIHTYAGNGPFEECKEILNSQNLKRLDIGQAVLTSGGSLSDVKAIVHAVGPDFRIKSQKAKGTELLKAAYRNSLEIAKNYEEDEYKDYVSAKFDKSPIQSIAIPAISAGIYAAPLDEAAPLALETVRDFVEEYPDAYEEVRFVFLPLKFDSKTGPAFVQALEELQ